MKGGPTDAIARYLANVGGSAKSSPPKTQSSPDGSYSNLGNLSGMAGLPPGVSFPSNVGAPGWESGVTAPGNGGATLPAISTDYSSDPALQEIISGGIKDEASAQAAALAARRNTLSQYGDQSLAKAILGADDPTIGSISDDPNASTSTLARINKGYNDSVHQTTEDDNANNLFYGGAHLHNLQDLAQQETTQKADASSAVQAALDQIAGGLSTAQGNIRQQRISGEESAADRAAQAAILAALAGGTGATGGGTTDTSGATDPNATDPNVDPNVDPNATDPNAGLFYDPVKKTWVQRPAFSQGYDLIQ